MAAVFVKEYFFISCNSAYRRFLSIRLTAEKSLGRSFRIAKKVKIKYWLDFNINIP